MSSGRKTLLVTGGRGAIGSFVVEAARDSGHRAIVLTRSDKNAEPPDTIFCDIRDAERLGEVLDAEGVTHIVHLAATLLDCESDPLRGFSVNVAATAGLLDTALKHGIERVVVAGTKAAFGPLRGKWGYPTYASVPEDHPRRPDRAYGATKSMAEDVARLFRTKGLDAPVVRFGTTCGPGKSVAHGNSAITSRMIEDAAAGKAISVTQGGDEMDDIIYNGDVAAGILAVTFASKLSYDTYHIATGRLMSLHDLRRAILAHIPNADITIGPGLDFMGLGMGNYCLMAVDRIRSDVGFSHTRPVEDWVGDYIRRIRHP